MDVVLVLALPLALICLSSTGAGLMVSILSGFFQDVLRKSLPDQPAALTGFVALFLMLTILGHGIRRGLPGARALPGWPYLRRPVVAFLAWVVVSGIVFVARTGNVALWGLGAFFYLAPVFVVPFFSSLATRSALLERAARLYVILGVVAALSVIVSFLGVQSWALDSVGVGVVAYDVELGPIKLFCGLLRSSETAAWHGAMTSMLLVLAVLTVRRRWAWWIGALVPVIVFATLLTGRRKAVVSVVIFCVVLGLLLLRGRVGRLRMVMAGAAGVVGIVAMLLSPLFSGDLELQRRPYFRRSQSTLGSFDDRLSFTMDSLRWSFYAGGMLGLGPGASAQGGQYFGMTSSVGAAESGIGKIFLELGLVGVLLGARAVFRLTSLLARTVLRRDSSSLPMSGAAAILIANAASFSTAQQVFGDPFVLVILSSVLGYMLSAGSRIDEVPGRRVALPDRA